MTDDYDKGWVEGSDAQNQADHQHLIEPLEKEIEQLQAENKDKDIVIESLRMSVTAAKLGGKIAIKIVDEISDLLGIETEQWTGKPQEAIKQLQVELEQLESGLRKIRMSDEIMEARRFAEEALKGE